MVCTLSAWQICVASACLRSTSRAFSNWPNQSSTWRWSAFSSVMASGVPSPFDFACFARAMGDTSVLAGACCRVRGKRAVASRPQGVEELPSALRLKCPTSRAVRAVPNGRHCQDDLGHKESAVEKHSPGLMALQRAGANAKNAINVSSPAIHGTISKMQSAYGDGVSPELWWDRVEGAK